MPRVSTIATLMTKFLSNLLIFVLAFTLTSCGTLSPMERKDNADKIALSNGFNNKLVRGDKFLIYTYQKITDQAKPYVIYIEGDGFIASRGSISSDPTPRNPVLITLASIDNRPNVVYIARPCQYSLEYNSNICDKSYWTSKRLSNDSVESINEVIKTIARNNDVNLVGFSGGGGIAILVAARNPNIKSVITIAGNLDHIKFNKIHNAEPMMESLNPIDYTAKIQNIPQLHLSGEDDKIVPPVIAESFTKKSSSKCVHQKTFAGCTHAKGWSLVWKDIIKEPLTCHN